MSELIKSRKRVVQHGEVLTPEWLVNAMLELVKPETERIDSRFLEPACGTGNFLAEILERKLRVVEQRYRRSQLDYERYAILAVSGIYGIDILEDNASECRGRLFGIVDQRYSALFKKTAKEQFREAARFILKRNIVWGDALTLKTVCGNADPIVFSEWSLVSRSLLKRRDFAFHELLPGDEKTGSLLDIDRTLISDTGEKVFIPEPVNEYPPVNFLEVARACADEL